MIPYLRFEILSDTYLPSPYMNMGFSLVTWLIKAEKMALLQIAIDSYYKLRQLFYYKVRQFITSCDKYYKLRQYP